MAIRGHKTTFIAFVCEPGCDVVNFEINRLFNQAVFLHDQNRFST